MAKIKQQTNKKKYISARKNRACQYKSHTDRFHSEFYLYGLVFFGFTARVFVIARKLNQIDCIYRRQCKTYGNAQMHTYVVSVWQVNLNLSFHSESKKSHTHRAHFQFFRLPLEMCESKKRKKNSLFHIQ